MTMVGCEYIYTMQRDAHSPVSADVVFATSRLNQIVEVKEDLNKMSMKEMVAKETAFLLEQQKRLSVRDLASKFEKGLAAATKLSDEVEALAVQLTRREGELIQEKTEVKKLANFLKQASEDAKQLVDEERAFARAEIENAKAAVQRVEEALQEHETMSRASGNQDVEELMKEVQEARRIKMLHQPSRVMDMEHELQALRIQLAEKSKRSLQLQKEVEALAVQLTRREGELIQEKTEVKKLANFLKQASEDAKQLVDEERAFARAEIENAKVAVQRVEEALQEHETMSRASGNQDVEELMKEVQEARRIKMLHQPSRVMDMEHELQALRIQLAEKSKRSLQLQKELVQSKKGDKNTGKFYEIDGTEALGSYLRIYPCSDCAPDLSQCAIQWYRSTPEGCKKEIITGATKFIYAPEPIDVGRILHAEILSTDQTITVSTSAPLIQLLDWETMLKHWCEVVIQMDGVDHSSQSIHVLHIGKMRIKLRKGNTILAKEYYSNSMQLCGVRGGGNAAAQAAYWQAKAGQSFVLAFESERERNAAIMLARRFAFDCNIVLAGPDVRSTAGR